MRIARRVDPTRHGAGADGGEKGARACRPNAMMPLLWELEDNINRVLATKAFADLAKQPPLEVADSRCQAF